MRINQIRFIFMCYYLYLNYNYNYFFFTYLCVKIKIFPLSKYGADVRFEQRALFPFHADRNVRAPRSGGWS